MQRRLIFLISLAFAVITVVWGFEPSTRAQSPNGGQSALQIQGNSGQSASQTQGNAVNVTPSPQKSKLSKNNQRMIEQAEWAKIRRQNILAGPQGEAVKP